LPVNSIMQNRSLTKAVFFIFGKAGEIMNYRHSLYLSPVIKEAKILSKKYKILTYRRNRFALTYHYQGKHFLSPMN
jgi:hypothetical protein